MVAGSYSDHQQRHVPIRHPNDLQPSIRAGHLLHERIHEVQRQTTNAPERPRTTSVSTTGGTAWSDSELDMIVLLVRKALSGLNALWRG